MERLAAADLDRWLIAPRRRPLVLRGARQVGKTWLVRELARRSGRDLAELNFERDPALAAPFAGGDARAILSALEFVVGRPVTPERSLLFLDELQAAPAVLARLRWLHEDVPALPVVGAGSLLEFALGDVTPSWPVGRIAFRHVEPLGFLEYLRAHGETRTAEALGAWEWGRPFPATLHERARSWHHRYAMVGGMPAVVAADASGATPAECRELQRDLVAAYRADFARYGTRLDRDVLDRTLRAVARALGQKFVFSHVGEGVRHTQARRALELMADARLCHLVRWSAGNGVPLEGETKDSFRKVMLVDVGVFHALAGTPAGASFPALAQLSPAVRGQLAEQLIGQGLRLGQDASGDGPRLHYWQREGGRPGEVDYLIAVQGRVVPVELKAGAAGAMKSLHQFVAERACPVALRFDDNPPSVQEVDVRTTRGAAARYRLHALPHYLAERAAALLETYSPARSTTA